MTDNSLVITRFTPLTPDQCVERDILDAELDRNEDSFLSYLRALMTYRRKHLWVGTFDSWEAYLASRRKKYTRQRADQLINHVEVLDNLTAQGVDVLPENERQSRAIYSILEDPKEQAAAWLMAQTSSGKDQPSSTVVASATDVVIEMKASGGNVLVGGVETPLDAALTEKQLERLQRQKDHIKTRMASKPAIAKLIGKPISRPADDFSRYYLTIHLAEPLGDDDFARLREANNLRCIFYEIPVPDKKEEAGV